MADVFEQLKKGFSNMVEGKGETDTIKPNYYHKGGIDVIGFMGTKANKDEQVGFLRWNIVKYVTRYRDKNGVEDLRKAEYYLQRLIELEDK